MRGPAGKLICCDCGAAISNGRTGLLATNRLSALIVIAFGAYLLLLMLITGLRREDAEQPRGQSPIQKLNAEQEGSGAAQE